MKFEELKRGLLSALIEDKEIKILIPGWFKVEYFNSDEQLIFNQACGNRNFKGLNISKFDYNPIDRTQIKEACELIKDHYERICFEKILNMAKKELLEGKEPETIINEIQNFKKIFVSESDMPLKSIYEVCQEEIISIYNEIQAGENKNYIEFPSKYYFIQRWRLARGAIHIIAGRPSMGKSAFAHWCAQVLCENPLLKGIFFSLEMDKTQIASRSIAMAMNINSEKVQFRRFEDSTDFENFQMQYAESEKKGMTLLCDFSQNAGISYIARVARKYKPSFIVVDHLAHIRCIGQKKKKDFIEDNIRDLLDLAIELNIPVIVVHQLNRNVESNINNGKVRPPILSDLKDSGEIEQLANTVMLLHRPEYYLKDAEPVEGSENYFKKHDLWENSMNAIKGYTEADLKKNRLGSSFKFKLKFNPESNLFERWI